MRRWRQLAAGLSAAVWLATARPAYAGDPARAKELFNAGAHAYSLGAFAAAARAFEDAYAEDPQPAILFSLSQARRRQYVVEPRRETLQQALAGFEEYLKLVAQGGRRADAAQAVEELRAILAALPQAAPLAPPEPPATPKTASLIVSSPTRAATLTLDGQAASPLPFVGEISPGLHSLVIAAPGYEPSRREVLFPAGGLATFDVPLPALPSHLHVMAEPGVSILVDGRPSGQTPLSHPIQLSAGKHIVTTLRRGRESIAEEIDTERGESRTIQRSLPLSNRRIAAYGFAGAAAAGLITGATFGLVAVARKDTADELLAKRDRVGLAPGELSTYNDARKSRDLYRTVSAATLVGSAGLLAIGGFLYLFEEPSAAGVPVRFSPRPDAPGTAPPRERPPAEVSLVPLIGPTWGLTAAGSF